MSFYSVRISFILINHYVISFRFTSSRKSSNMIYSLSGYLVRLCLGKDTFFYSGVIYPRPPKPIISLLRLKAFRNQIYKIQSLLLFFFFFRSRTTNFYCFGERNNFCSDGFWARSQRDWTLQIEFFPRVFIAKCFARFYNLNVVALNYRPQFKIHWTFFFRFSHGPRKLQMSRWLRILPTSLIMRQILEMR